MIGSKCYSSSYYFGVELRARVVEWEKKECGRMEDGLEQRLFVITTINLYCKETVLTLLYLQ